MSIAEWFSNFEAALAVNNGGTIAERARRITRRLNSTYWNTDSEFAHRFYAGSYGRTTAIRRLSDVDMIYELPASVFVQYDNYAGNGQSALLQSVRQTLRLSFPSTQIAADGQVVVVPFSDGNRFEVVPAFLNDNGTHLYADTNNQGQWKLMEPKAEIEAMRARNLACNGNLIPLCKFMRAWKDYVGVGISGILIDTLAYQFIERWQYRDKSYLYYDFMSRDFFRFLADQDKSQSWWRAPGSGRWVFGGGFQFRANQAHATALAAIEAEMDTPKRPWTAVTKWRSVYGPAFG